MKSRIASFAFLLCLTGCAATPVTTDELIAERAPPAVEVMVLGTYHMGNPGADMVNMEADDVLAPARPSLKTSPAASPNSIRPPSWSRRKAIGPTCSTSGS